MPAILFGSISGVADTDELQRAAFNEAFKVHGLDWRWDREHYRAMLGTSGRSRHVHPEEVRRATTVVTHSDAGHRTLLPGETPIPAGQLMRRGGRPAADTEIGLTAWPHPLSPLGLQSP